jgi:galactose mutarotase-like enzyme
MNTIEITSPDGSTAARFAPAAGIVCASLSIDGVERLDQRSGLDAYAAKGSTMGIPLLYPWANRLGARSFETLGRRLELPEDPTLIHADGTGAPIHGLIPSLMRWEAVVADDRASLTARLSWSDPQLLALFPFAHELELHARAGARELAIEVAVSAGAEPVPEPVPVSFGFHPYLKLAGAPREAWTIELPERNDLTLDQRMLPTGGRTSRPATTVRLADHGFDDAYELIAPRAVFTARAGEHAFEVALEQGYRYAQVFSPVGAEFICFEPMTSPGNALVSGDGLEIVEPGQSIRSKFRICAIS